MMPPAKKTSTAWFQGPKARHITAQPAGLGGGRAKTRGLKARHIPAADVSGFQPSNVSPIQTQPFGLGFYVTGLRP
jgi:hypothetical protein